MSIGYTRLESLRSEIFGATFPQRAARLDLIQRLVASRWQLEATRRIRTHIAAYLASIASETTENSVIISLPGKDSGRASFLARMMEFGFGPGGIGTYTGGKYDMRLLGEKLLSRKKKSRTGKVIIPFSHSKKTASANIGSDVDIKESKIKTTWGAKLPSGIGKKLKPHHATTLESGMVKSGVRDSRSGKEVATGYTTFRTVPEGKKKNPLSWMSKGIEPRDIAGRYVIPAIPEMLKDAGLI
jgi:hypothetical protein